MHDDKWQTMINLSFFNSYLSNADLSFRLEQLGYSDPVRMCNQCFALLDETFVEVEYSEIGDMN